jgi:hypothetical protein
MTKDIKEIFAYVMADKDGEGILASYIDDSHAFYKPLMFPSLLEANGALQTAIDMGNEYKSIVRLVRFDNRELFATLVPKGFQ